MRFGALVADEDWPCLRRRNVVDVAFLATTRCDNGFASRSSLAVGATRLDDRWSSFVTTTRLHLQGVGLL